jgi:ketosteroid isomerase-like protein
MPPPKAQTASLLASPDDVEAQFYEAMQQADIAKLMAVWSDDDEVACVHPGGPRIIGAVAIRASFEAIFANGAVAVAAHGVQRLHTLHSAVHHVVERITLGAAHDQQHAWVMATNVYLKTAQGWRLVVHHASPGSQQQPAAEPGPAPSTLH